MTDPIRNQPEQDAALDEARNEGFEEGYAEGAADQAGWATDTAHAVLRWLDKEGDGFDIHHPDGNTADAIIQGLYDAKRSGNLTELRQAAARLRSMEEALSFYADPGNWFGTYCVGADAPMVGDHDLPPKGEWPDTDGMFDPEGKPGKLARDTLRGERQ